MLQFLGFVNIDLDIQGPRVPTVFAIISGGNKPATHRSLSVLYLIRATFGADSNFSHGHTASSRRKYHMIMGAP